jgi:hypothetical protein
MAHPPSSIAVNNSKTAGGSLSKLARRWFKHKLEYLPGLLKPKSAAPSTSKLDSSSGLASSRPGIHDPASGNGPNDTELAGTYTDTIYLSLRPNPRQAISCRRVCTVLSSYHANPEDSIYPLDSTPLPSARSPSPDPALGQGEITICSLSA